MVQNELNNRTSIGDFGKFPLLKNQKVEQRHTSFLNKEQGYMETSELEALIRKIVREELALAQQELNGLQIIDGEVYIGSEQLLKKSDIIIE
jgi:hypothetical protein